MARRLRIRWAPDSAVDARLALPPKGRGPASVGVGVVLAHGAGAGQHHRFMVDVRDGLAAAGFPTMTFDYAYTEAGRKAPDRLDRLLAVHLAAAERMSGYVDRVVLAGKSMGGRIGSHLAGDQDWPACGLAYYGYPLVALGKSDPRPTSHLDAITVPQLFLAGTRDALGPIKLIRAVAAAVPDGAIYEVDEGDHSFRVPKRTGRTQAEVMDGLVAATAAWLAGLTASRH